MAEHQTANGNGSRWWTTWLPVIASGFAVLAIMATYFSGQGANTQTIATLQTRIDDLERRLAKADIALTGLELGQTRDCEQFAKTETQMGAVENAINESHVSDVRQLGALNLKVFGEQAPSVYYAISIPHDLIPCGR